MLFSENQSGGDLLSLSTFGQTMNTSIPIDVLLERRNLQMQLLSSNGLACRPCQYGVLNDPESEVKRTHWDDSSRIRIIFLFQVSISLAINSSAQFLHDGAMSLQDD